MTKLGHLIHGKTRAAAREALDLLHWLSEQQEALLLASREEFRASPEPPAEQRQQTEWSLADEQEMRSEDERVACFEL